MKKTFYFLIGLGIGALIAVSVAGVCFRVYRYYSYGEGLGKAKGAMRSLKEKWPSKPQETQQDVPTPAPEVPPA